MAKTPAYFDVECYPNYFLVMLMIESGQVAAFEMVEGDVFPSEKLRAALTHQAIELYSFNGNNYDVPMIRHAMAGASTRDLQELSTEIIERDRKPWQLDKEFKLAPLTIDHVDLIEVAPGMNGLKTYGGRLHEKHLQDLPIEPGTVVDEEQRAQLRTYCINDLKTTQSLRKALAGAVELRSTMSRQINEELAAADLLELFGVVDLRSKSDAQIAETVLKQRVFMATGLIPRKQDIRYTWFKYEPPAYLRFGTRKLQDVLETARRVDFVIGESGHVEMPVELEKLSIEINGTTYKMGIGGLHSQESEVSHQADDQHLLRDIDVRSYYPNLMLNMGMYPDSMGPHFLTEYRKALVQRLDSKDEAVRLAKRIAELEMELSTLD